MTPRDRRLRHATESPRARRIREAIEREEALRARASSPRSATRRRPSRPRRWKRIVIGLLAVVLLSSCTGGWLLWQRVAAFNDTVSSAPSVSSALFFPLMGSDRVNVAMYGYGGPEHGGAYLADSIIILSIDPQTNTTTMIPIPRDLWVEGLPQLPDNAKINEAFAIGWLRGGVAEAGRASTAVLSTITGLHIEHWLAIDFTGFKAMVETVGGVTVDNPVAFSYTWSEPMFHAGNWDGGSFEAGTISLNGEAALSYARNRYTSVPAESSDFARSVRQQRVLAALRGKLGGGGLGSLGPGLALMDALTGQMGTDLSAIDLYLLSSHLGADRRIELAEGVILEATSNSIGQYILVVAGRSSGSDYAPLQAFLQAELARPLPSPSPAGSAAP